MNSFPNCRHKNMKSKSKETMSWSIYRRRLGKNTQGPLPDTRGGPFFIFFQQFDYALLILSSSVNSSEFSGMPLSYSFAKQMTPCLSMMKMARFGIPWGRRQSYSWQTAP